MTELPAPGTSVRSGGLRGVVLDPAEASMPPRGAKCVFVRWQFSGYPSYSTTWERADDLEICDD